MDRFLPYSLAYVLTIGSQLKVIKPTAANVPTNNTNVSYVGEDGMTME